MLKEVDFLNSYERKVAFMTKMLNGLINGPVNSFIVSGAPGIGKTFNVSKILEEHEEAGKIEYYRTSGKITPYSFYQFLSSSRSPESVLFFDDCDSVLTDPVSLNLLKAASELSRKRSVSWKTTTDNGVENSFYFEGKIIISTNIKIKSNPHFNAVMDRFHIYELEVSMEERLAKIKDISSNDTELKTFCEPKVLDEIYKFIFDLRDKIDENKFSIRSFKKLVELYTILPDEWRDYAIEGKYIPMKWD